MENALRLILSSIYSNLFIRCKFPTLLPPFLTLNVTYKCNSKCKTCNIWKIRKKVKELSIQEYEKIFKQLKKLFWVSITGGEPFLRKDLEKIIYLLCKYTRPKIVSITTNGTLTASIVSSITSLLKRFPTTIFVVNLSLDGIGNTHDKIRGRNGCFNEIIKTYFHLKKVSSNNLIVGLSSTISIYNSRFLPQLLNFSKEILKPDSHVVEFAQQKKELFNLASKKISPRNYKELIKLIINDLKMRRPLLFITWVIKRLRLNYYKSLLLRKKIRCFAGYASAEVMPNGEVWACGVKKYVFGNLRDVNYKFTNLWVSSRATKIRKKIKKCHCELASSFYVNSICNFYFLKFV